MNIKRLLITTVIALTTSIAHAATTADVVCSYAPSQIAAVDKISSGAGGAGAGAAAILKATGLQFVAHSSGGYILTGSGGYVAGTLLSPLAVPTAVAAIVLIAGTPIVVELSCAPRNHPDAINSVKKITAVFNQAVRSANSKAVDVRDGTVEKVLELNEDAIIIRDRALGKINHTNNLGIELRDKASLYFAGFF